MQKILALSGRKQAGKNVSANYVIGLYLSSLGEVQQWGITDDGKLYVYDMFGSTDFEGVLDIQRQTESMAQYRADRLDPYFKLYSFADLLKEQVCMNVLGLTYEQCFGSDADKNTLTDLRWEDMPGVTTDESYNDRAVQEVCGMMLDKSLIYHEPGQMTAREVMQYIGTDVFRKVYPNVWADATIRKIKADGTDMAIICDCRFPNEVEAITKAGGKVIRYTRDPLHDMHSSETALDKENFDWGKFSHVIDNADLTIIEQCTETFDYLNSVGWSPITDRHFTGEKIQA